MHIFLSAFDEVPDPRAENARHDLGELLVIAFVSVLCGATSCAEMSAFGRAKANIFRWGGCRPPQTASQCARMVV